MVAAAEIPLITFWEWEIIEDQPDYVANKWLSIRADNYVCLIADRGVSQEEQKANAKLIAQAPRMYEALKGLAPCQRPVPNGETPYEWAISEKAMVKVRQATAAVEGK